MMLMMLYLYLFTCVRPKIVVLFIYIFKFKFCAHTALTQVLMWSVNCRRMGTTTNWVSKILLHFQSNSQNFVVKVLVSRSRTYDIDISFYTVLILINLFFSSVRRRSVSRFLRSIRWRLNLVLVWDWDEVKNLLKKLNFFGFCS